MGFLHCAKLYPYIDLTKNCELGAGDSAVDGFVRVHRSPLDAVPFGNIYWNNRDQRG